MTDRIDRLRTQALSTTIVGDPDWERLWNESMAATGGEPDLVRQAKALSWYWQHRQIGIRDDELIVGARAGIVYGDAPVRPVAWGRQQFGAPWFPVQPEVAELFKQGVLSFAGNHGTMDYGCIIREGLEGLVARIEERMARLGSEEPGAVEKKHFLEALAIVARGYIAFCRRYADLADKMAQGTANAQRGQELENIAAACRRAPALPPRSFREACQCLWFCFMLVPDAPGRVDQYLGPFYRRDIDDGRLTRDQAVELLSCLWIRYFENAGAVSPVGAQHHLTLGGVGPDGADASNEVTWLCLEVTEKLHIQRPQVGLRCNANTPPGLMDRAVEVLGAQCGSPDFCNDEQIIPALVQTGIALDDARDFSLSGCSEVIITGKAQMGSVEGFVNMPKVLRVVLGLEPALGPGADLDRVADLDQLWAACEAELGRVADSIHQSSIERDKGGAGNPDLTCSLVVNDCIERAMGYTQGGARYNHCNWDVVGIANLADSLAAIRRIVFEERAVSLREFAEAVGANWEGREALRQRVVNACPHFGNDDDSVDLLARQIVEKFSAMLKQYRPFRGGEYILGTLAGAENMHIEFGRVTGATPDGRRAGEPLADSMGAAQGRDRHGVTALLNSVAKLPHRLLPTASTLNVRLDPKLVSTHDGVSRIAALVRAHFHAGGQQIQFNLVNRQMLLDAQTNPDQHAGLMVRVAGYSAPFVCLWSDLQEEIISRTEHTA